MSNDFLNEIKWNKDGLIAAIAQDHVSHKILMLAWMNEESVLLSLEENRAIYWSRSRDRLWRKGEESGNVQHLKGLYLDCDGDSLILSVEQIGGVACHTGRESCFYRKYNNDPKQPEWEVVEDVLKDPKALYANTSGSTSDSKDSIKD